jgi:hypothetical protein
MGRRWATLCFAGESINTLGMAETPNANGEIRRLRPGTEMSGFAKGSFAPSVNRGAVGITAPSF